MKHIPLALTIVLVTLATDLTPALSQQPDAADTEKSQRADNHATVAQPPMSIFNNQIRRFKFRFDDQQVTRDTAEAFMLRYNRPDNPRIIGAYPDPETNSLVVIGAPEVEQAVRENLAEWIVEIQASGTPSLEMQKRNLAYRRRELLTELANIEVEQVKAAGGGKKEARGQLQSRLQYFEDELKLVERQIKVVNKYFDRLHNDGPSSGKSTRARQRLTNR